VVDSVLAADAVEQHLDWGLGEAAGEDLAVVGQNLERHAVGLHGRVEAVADRLSSLAGHEASGHAVPRVVVDSGQGLGAAAVSEQETVHHVQLPQLHRSAALPPLPGLPPPASRHRVDDRGPDQTAIDS